MKVFYVQNEKQLKKLILSDIDLELEDLTRLYLLGCDYIKSRLSEDECFDPYDNNCGMCEQEICLLFGGHIHDKDVLNHIYVDQEIEYPILVIIHDSQCERIIECVSVNEAKKNTRYIG